MCSEVRQSLSNAQGQYSQWTMLLDSEVDIDKIQNISLELRNCIKSIEWDLEDLDQTISKCSLIIKCDRCGWEAGYPYNLCGNAQWVCPILLLSGYVLFSYP